MENVLKGKKLALDGDSVCQGAGCAGGYGTIIAERNGMILQNLAIGGGTVTAGQLRFSQSQNQYVPRHCICESVLDLDEDADYILVDGGVNDASLDEPVPLGTLSEGYSAELDDHTFYGAFELMLKRLLIRFPGKKLGYIALHKMTSGFSSNGEHNYYHAAKACCEKWGIPFLDLNTTVPPFRYFEEDGDPALYAMRQKYTLNGDGWHPTEAGYLEYYCDKIEAWMKTL